MPSYLPPFLRLNNDELGVINAFTANQNLSVGSRWLEGDLTADGTSMEYTITDANVDSIHRAIKTPLLSLVDTSFTIPRFTRGIQNRLSDLYAYMYALTIAYTDEGEDAKGTLGGALVGLDRATYLTTLYLNFDHPGVALPIGRAVGQRLRALTSLPHLHTLRLGLAGNQIDHLGFNALGALRLAPFLETLRINLTDNQIRPRSARSLAELAWSPRLKDIHLELKRTGIDAAGVALLSTLKHIVGLHTLRFDLSDNLIGGGCIKHLMELDGASKLHTLSLDLSGNAIGDVDPSDFLGLCRAPVLANLCIDLSRNRISDPGVLVLSKLKHAPFLETLALELGSNRIGDAGAIPLAELKESPTLQSITISLRGNRVADSGAGTLGTLIGSGIHSLDLNLAGNGRITEHGICALAASANRAPRLHTLCLNLSRLRIDEAGVYGLVEALRVNNTIRKLHIDLSDNQINNIGVIRLGELNEMQSVVDLSLSLRLNNICTSGPYFEQFDVMPLHFARISLLGTTDIIETLHLNLSKNPIGDKVAIIYWLLVHKNTSAPNLHTIELDLGHTELDDDGVQSISGLSDKSKPTVKALRLILNGNRITRTGVRHLSLFANSSLDSLFINLNANRVSFRECEWALRGLMNLDHLNFKFEAEQRGGGLRHET
jgi:hypothetical protein